MVRVPEVREQIEQNRLSLTAASKLATHVRREKIDPSQTAELLGEIQGKPTREVEWVLASHATEPVSVACNLNSITKFPLRWAERTPQKICVTYAARTISSQRFDSTVKNTWVSF